MFSGTANHNPAYEHISDTLSGYEPNKEYKIFAFNSNHMEEKQGEMV